MPKISPGFLAKKATQIVVVTLVVFASYFVKLMTPVAIWAEIPFLIFFSAVVISGIYGGFFLGLYASLLSAAMSSYFFIEPLGVIYKGVWNSDLKVLLYLVDCFTISSLCGKLKASRKSAQMALETRDNFFLLPKVLFALADSSGHFTEVNEAWTDLLGFSREELTSNPWLYFVHPEDVERTRLEGEKLMHGFVSVQFTNRYRTKSGDYKWLMWSVNPIGNVLYAAARDVTDLKHAENALIQARDSAEMANKAKSHFLANMSHEIRTPLGVIMGFAELANEPGRSAAELSQSLGRILRNSRHLAEIVDEILDLAKIEANKLEIERKQVVLNDFLNELNEWAGLRAKDRGIEYHFVAGVDLPAIILTDATKLRQILTNVLGNAIKFTERGKVEFKVKCQNDLFVFQVADTGIGMSEDHKLRLFQAFTQADSSITRKFGGTGLGLALSKKLAIALGGDLTLRDSQLGHGSTFMVTLPRLSAEVVPLVPIQDSIEKRKNVLGSLKVLLVEDSLDNQVLITTVLNSAGANVECANNGREGLSLALEKQFDVIVMDIQMPLLDGREATRSLRQMGYSKPIIGLSAHAFKGEREKALNEGFSEYLTKPINRVDLIRAVENLAT